MEGLLEREAELAALDEVVRGLGEDHGRLVLVAGEAGIGKTSLIRALRTRTEATFLVGACEPLSVPVPLAPLRELAEAASGLDLTELEGADRLRLASALLEALTARAPVVAVIEDAHWADPTTLDVVRLLARRVESAPVALLVTYRDDEVAANPELARLLGDLATAPAVRRIALRPLSSAAVRELAEPTGVDARRVAQMTGGNPFLVVESIAAGDALPASVRDATLARAGRLSPEARAAVEAAASIGQRSDPALLEAVAPGSGAAVEEALARGVLVADGAALGFRHELLREAIESAIAPPRRAELHGRVVAALAGRADHALLAHHAELAGLTADAARYAALAATEAERVGALAEASLQAERALRLGAGLSDEERFELLLQRARTANFAVTDLQAALPPVEEALALAQRLGDPVRHGRALMTLALPLWSLDRVGEAREAAERAVEVLEPTGDIETLVRAHATHLRMQATAFDPGAVIEAGPAALELAARAGLDDAQIDITISLGLARGHRGDPEALELLADAAGAARRAGLTIPTVRCYVNLVYQAAAMRRHDIVDEVEPEAQALFREYGATIPGYAIELYRARSLMDRGRWDDALSVAGRTDRDWAAEAAVARAMAALIAARRGQEGAGERLAGAWAEIESVPKGSRHARIRLALVEAAWLHGDRAGAIRELRAARETSEAARYAREDGELALWAMRCGLPADPPPNAPEPIALELAGDWRAAIAAWTEVEAPYEAALAALPGDDQTARTALATLQRLGASGAARAFSRERAALGGSAPRGPRRSTLAHPAGLTRREQEVLEQLARGATNPAIAAALQISERTAAHHVSAILGKLGAPNRTAAIERARAQGLLAER